MASGDQSARVLITGAGGQLGSYLRSSLEKASCEVIGVGRNGGPGVNIIADITDVDQVARAIRQAQPDVIIHCAAYTDVDGCERDPGLADIVNRLGAQHVAGIAAEQGVWTMGISTDFVFSGAGGAPYAEEDVPDPISVYGESKLAGERAVLSADSSFAVARTAWVYGGRGKHFPRTVLHTIRARGQMEVVNDEMGSPTFASDLADALTSLMVQRPSGLFHLVNEGAVSRFQLAQFVTAKANLDPALVLPVSTEEFLQKYPLLARRPANSTLLNIRAVSRGVRLPPWEDAVARYVPMLMRELDVQHSDR